PRCTQRPGLCAVRERLPCGGGRTLPILHRTGWHRTDELPLPPDLHDRPQGRLINEPHTALPLAEDYSQPGAVPWQMVLPAAFAPFAKVRTLGADRGGIAMAREDLGPIGELFEDAFG